MTTTSKDFVADKEGSEKDEVGGEPTKGISEDYSRFIVHVLPNGLRDPKCKLHKRTVRTFRKR